MKRNIVTLLLIPVVALVFTSNVRAADQVFPKVEGHAPASGKVYPKVETHISAHSKSEALAINRRIRIDIGKVEAELSKVKQGPAAKSPAAKKGQPAPDTRAETPPGLKNASESLLRETVKLSRLHEKEKLAAGTARHSGPMKKDADRLHRLALDYGKSSGTPRAERALGEMRSVLGRLKNQNSAHERWIQGLKPGTGTQPVGKPVPATMKIQSGTSGFAKTEPGVGITAPGTLPGQGSETGFDGVDGENQGEAQSPGTILYPKVEVPGGQTGYKGVDGESLGQ